jgi:hypothetical protein
MSCVAYRDDLTDAALGELAPEREAAFAAHAAECAACRAALSREQLLFAAMDRALACAVAGEPSAQFAANVRARIAGEVEPELLTAINRGVAATVAAGPSPQFAAAVRARIAEEGARPTPWFTGWLGWRWLVPAAGLAAAALLIWLAQPSEPPVVKGPHGPAAPIVQPAKNVEPAPPVTPPGLQQVVRRRIQPVPQQAPPRRSPWGPAGRPGDELEAPAVQVSTAEWRTLARFYQGVQSGAYNAGALLGEPIVIARAVEPLETPELKTIPIEVKELSPPAKSSDPGTNQ